MTHQQHQTTGVLVSGWTSGGWVKHIEAHIPGRKAIASGDDATGNTLLLQNSECRLHTRTLLVGESWRYGDLTHRKSTEEFRQAVEVIEIGVRKEDFVDTTDASTPQVRRDHSAHCIGTGRGPRIVEQHAAVWCFNHHTATMPNREESDSGLIRTSRRQTQRKAETGPHDNRNETVLRRLSFRKH